MMFCHHFTEACKRHLFLKTTIQVTPTSSETLSVTSTAGKGAIRRIAGRAVHKAERQNQRIIKFAITKCKNVTSAKSIMSHIRYLKISSTAVALGSYSNTAIETERRQRHSKGLTHIEDEVFKKESLELHTTPSSMALM